MTQPLSHDDAWAALSGVALDALPAAERGAVLAHAATCEQCGPELTALRDSVAGLAMAAAAAPLDPVRSGAVRARLLARAAADARLRQRGDGGGGASGRPLHGVGAARRASWRPVGWLAAAAVAAFAVAGFGLLRATRERDALRAELRLTRARDEATADSLQAVRAEQARTLAAITGPAVRVVELTAAGTRAPTARMFWDRASNRWTMFAHDLPTPPPGRTYQLWLVTGDAKISAGTFVPTAAGGAVVHAEYALAPDALRAIAVTEEPAGGVPQPTGPVVLAGAAGS